VTIKIKIRFQLSRNILHKCKAYRKWERKKQTHIYLKRIILASDWD
jgi:hypothetical protein